MDSGSALLKMYALLEGRFGDLHWWPADSPFEVVVGAILTQNTAWTQVEKAISALKEEELLSPDALLRIDEGRLAGIIRPSGFYRLKAARLKAITRFIVERYGGCIDRMSDESLPVLREKLLGVKGVGPETADSILLYACRKPVFISDAYTKRILQRHGLIGERSRGADISAFFMHHLPHSAPLFNQFHALLVETGKRFCRKKPKCASCPLGPLLTQQSNG